MMMADLLCVLIKDRFPVVAFPLHPFTLQEEPTMVMAARIFLGVEDDVE